ncbi:tRNA glutamyl-Q(34) synthetase GluQRS [Vibrio sp.]|uniref:tRNA glutamyl-Q(34) synthetase GluQRS n=1 Tax=Vibrio sp. TaxID=678 RepID=UPI003D0FDF56
MQSVGRFAPSPSGPLHFGSLVAALGSYLQARAQHGLWLVRMEDLDPPREMAGADKLILSALEAYHLYWDEEVIYQSQRHHLYQDQLDNWLRSGQAYLCRCTRKQIKAAGGFYPGTCRNLALTDSQQCSVRLKVDQPVYSFIDARHGEIMIPAQLAEEDFIIKRRDGLYAYNLAVVLDDISQGVTEIVRGADLIEPTGRQLSLYQILGANPPSYLHLPLATDASGNKLSKQNHAQPIDIKDPKPLLLEALQFLGFQLPRDIEQGELDQILAWAVQNWHLQQLPEQTSMTVRFSNGRL